MDVRPVLAPAIGVSMLALTSLARLDPAIAWLAALAGILASATYAFVPQRRIIVLGLVPVAAWIAVQPPWGALAGAVIVAGTMVIALGDLPTFRMARDAAIPFSAGIVAALLVGALAGRAGLVDGIGDALALLLTMLAFRAATVYLGGMHWGYGAIISAMGFPQFGPWGLLAAGIETAFSMGMLGTPVQHRMAFLAGAPLVLVALF